MTEALQMSDQETLTDTRNVTFSQALAAGLTHSGWLVGPTTDPFGQEAALASHLALPERVEDLKTSVTFGPLFGGSSHSAGLQSSLASKLRQRMGVNGSPEYELTWKSWDMKSGPPICALRASGRRISDSGCSGWRSPNQTDAKGESGPGCRSIQAGNPNRLADQLPMVLTGWRTPNATDSDHGGPNARDSSGSPHLTMQAQLAGWPTPRTITGGAESAERKQELGRTASGGGDLQAVVQMAGWPTPNSTDTKGDGQPNNRRPVCDDDLPARVNRIFGPTPSSSPAPTANGGGCLAGWCSPTAQDHSRGVRPPREQDTGIPLTQQVAGLANGKLNPRFSLWLMGYPIEWVSCGERATR